jgi:hypothetical protein
LPAYRCKAIVASWGTEVDVIVKANLIFAYKGYFKISENVLYRPKTLEKLGLARSLFEFIPLDP